MSATSRAAHQSISIGQHQQAPTPHNVTTSQEHHLTAGHDRRRSSLQKSPSDATIPDDSPGSYAIKPLNDANSRWPRVTTKDSIRRESIARERRRRRWTEKKSVRSLQDRIDALANDKAMKKKQVVVVTTPSNVLDAMMKGFSHHSNVTGETADMHSDMSSMGSLLEE